MSFSLRNESDRLRGAIRQVDWQTATVLLFAALAVILQMNYGDRGFFRREVAPLLTDSPTALHGWIWWFGMQGVLGFILPVAILRFGFRNSLSDMGLGAGDWRLAVRISLLYLPLVVIGTWFLSDSTAFTDNYPHYAPAARDWGVFFVYEAFFLFYWIGWEYLWRGFVLFGTARTFGVMAIFVQTVPFALMHYEKPMPEALLSIVGGVALGALVWRSRSFWIAVPIHAAQMMILDFWCSLRIRSGASGFGFEALKEVLRALFQNP